MTNYLKLGRIFLQDYSNCILHLVGAKKSERAKSTRYVLILKSGREIAFIPKSGTFSYTSEVLDRLVEAFVGDVEFEYIMAVFVQKTGMVTLFRGEDLERFKILHPNFEEVE